MQSSANICPWHIVLPEKCVSVVIYANLKKEREKASKHYANAEKFEHQSTYAMSYRTTLLLLFVYRDIYLLWRIDKDIDFFVDKWTMKSWNFFIRIKIYRLKKKKKEYFSNTVSRTIDTEIIDAMYYCHLYGKHFDNICFVSAFHSIREHCLIFVQCVSRMKVP